MDFGILYQTGNFEKAIAFRVDSPERLGFKKIVCGLCASSHTNPEPRKTGGSFGCEECGSAFGRKDLVEISIQKAVEIQKTEDQQ